MCRWHSHSVAANSTKITTTKATPSPFVFLAWILRIAGIPGVWGEGRTAALSSSRLIAAFGEGAGGGRGSSHPAEPV